MTHFVESSAADAVFTCSAGNLISGKPLLLGFALKSITGGKNAVILMNKLGHCAGNENLPRIEIGLELLLLLEHSTTPAEMVKLPDSVQDLHGIIGM